MNRLYQKVILILLLLLGQSALADDGSCRRSAKNNPYYSENPLGFDHLTEYLFQMHKEAEESAARSNFRRKIDDLKQRFFSSRVDDSKVFESEEKSQKLILAYMELLGYSQNEIKLLEEHFGGHFKLDFNLGYENENGNFALNKKLVKTMERYLVSTAQNRFRSVTYDEFKILETFSLEFRDMVESRFYRQAYLSRKNDNFVPIALKSVREDLVQTVIEGSLQSIDRFVSPKQKEWVEHNGLELFRGGFFVRNIGSRSPHEPNQFSGQGRGVFIYKSQSGQKLISYRPIDDVTITDILKFYEDIEKSSAKDFLLKPVGIHFVYGRARLLFPVKGVYFGRKGIARFKDLEEKVQHQLQELFVQEFYDLISHPDSRSFDGSLFENEYLFFKEDGFLGMALPVRAKMLMESFYKGKLYKSSEIEFAPKD